MKQMYEARVVNPSELEFVASVRRAAAETGVMLDVVDLRRQWEDSIADVRTGTGVAYNQHTMHVQYAGTLHRLRAANVIQWVWFRYDGTTVIRVVGFVRDDQEIRNNELMFRDDAQHLLDACPTIRALASEQLILDHDACELFDGAMDGDSWFNWHVLCDRLDEIQDARGEQLRRELPRITIP